MNIYETFILECFNNQKQFLQVIRNLGLENDFQSKMKNLTKKQPEITITPVTTISTKLQEQIVEKGPSILQEKLKGYDEILKNILKVDLASTHVEQDETKAKDFLERNKTDVMKNCESLVNSLQSQDIGEEQHLARGACDSIQQNLKMAMSALQQLQKSNSLDDWANAYKKIARIAWEAETFTSSPIARTLMLMRDFVEKTELFLEANPKIKEVGKNLINTLYTMAMGSDNQKLDGLRLFSKQNFSDTFSDTATAKKTIERRKAALVSLLENKWLWAGMWTKNITVTVDGTKKNIPSYDALKKELAEAVKKAV